MGLPVDTLADLAYRFALGGVDLIKDDHGLTDQSFGRFEARVTQVSKAVRRANDSTGGRCCYLPNVTAPADEIMDRVRLAKACGAGGLLIAPGLVGLDTQRRIADDDTIALPVFSHPAFQGSLTVNDDAGITPGVLFATLNRLAGADATIFPNFGGRFSFSKEACRDLFEKASGPMDHVRPIFPVPAGGMSLDRIPEMRRFYAENIILLIGGDLRRHGATIEESARRFVSAVSGDDLK
jgi:ribulose-bisphosphate carboxylase large chain